MRPDRPLSPSESVAVPSMQVLPSPDPALVQMAERYALAMQAGQVGLWDWNLQTQEFFVSPEMKVLLGYSEGELIHQPEAWFQQVYSQDRAWVRRLIQRYIQGVTPNLEMEYRIQDAEGVLHWLFSRGQALRDGTGQPYRLLGFTINITDRKRAETALQASEYRYYSLARMSPVGIFHCDAAGECLYVNERWRELTGLTLGESLGRSWLLQVHPDDRDRVQTEWQQAVIQDQPFFSEYRLLHTTQVACWVFGQAVAEKNIQGQVIGFIGTMTDIHQHKLLEQTLRLQAERERLMLAMQSRIRSSLNLTEILNTTVAEVRQFLATDRVILYRFEPDDTGVVVVESVAEGWIPLMNLSIADPCFRETYIDRYRQGRTRSIEDIHHANLSPCHLNLLTQFGVRANLVVPILQNAQEYQGRMYPDEPPTATMETRLWGLLIAHQCRGPRAWQQWELDLLISLASQVGIAIQQAQLYEQLAAANQELHRLATLDGLTQLANRRHFDQYFQQEWRRLRREQQSLALILCDIDCFKSYNDTYGHQAGDDCLKLVAAAIRQAVKRPADLVARYGGEEFAIVLPNTSATGALRVAQAIRETVAELQLAHQGSLVSPYVTLSLGVSAIVPQEGNTPEFLTKVADEALYEAKRQGRDRAILTELGL